jgi:hypothetical protein
MTNATSTTQPAPLPHPRHSMFGTTTVDSLQRERQEIRDKDGIPGLVRMRLGAAK